MKEGASQGRRQKEQEGGQVTYHWCKYHMAWCMHKPSECCLGKERKEKQQKMKPAYTANSATYAARLGIPIFGSNFWDPHWKQNSDLVFDSKGSGWNFFSNSAVEKLRNQNFDSEIRNSEKN
jgi:hypothetical protein